MMQHYTIQIAGTDSFYRAKQQSGQYWTNTLEKAHKNTFARCLCLDDDQDRRLAIKRKDGEYHLARFPDTGHLHRKTCRFYALSRGQSGMKGYFREVVEERDDGGISIKLERGLLAPKQHGDSTQDDATPQSEPRSPGVRRNAMSLLGLLHLCWTRAELNRWDPSLGKRFPLKIGNSLLRVAEDTHVSRRTLDEALLLPAQEKTHEEKRNQKIVRLARKSGLRLIVIGQLANYDNVKDADLPRLRLGQPYGTPGLRLSDSVRAALQGSFASELGYWRAGNKVWVIAQMVLDPDGKAADVLDVSLMRISDRYIPLDSSHEGQVEQMLAEAKRSFIKPLQFDSENDATFPDFWLLDMGGDYPMEVFGMSTPEYRQRMAEKILHYDAKYPDSWWFWDVIATTTITPLPDTLLINNQEQN